MKIVIPGGSGQVGTVLARAFHAGGHEVVVLSRLSRRSGNGAAWRVVAWDGKSRGGWEAAIDGSDVVINLAGRSVNCRYGEANRREIVDSRVHSTRIVGEAIARAARPPAVWLQASTATIYAHRYDAANDDYSGILGGDEEGAPETWRFSIAVAKAWERAFDEATTRGTRKVLLRSAMTMSADAGGVFDAYLGLVRKGLGGRMGDGRQFVSWIHHEDFVEAIRFLIARDEIEGRVNVASPNPVPNAAFMRALRQAWGIRFGLAPRKWMLEIGAVFLRTETELILKSRRVIPARLLAHGFVFRYPEWAAAAADLCGRWRQTRR
jgi:uncharacterized protein